MPTPGEEVGHGVRCQLCEHNGLVEEMIDWVQGTAWRNRRFAACMRNGTIIIPF